jgi:hypothetical protein
MYKVVMGKEVLASGFDTKARATIYAKNMVGWFGKKVVVKRGY